MQIGGDVTLENKTVITVIVMPVYIDFSLKC